MITPTLQNVCSIVSRQITADLSPTSRQRVADQSHPISNQLAINRPPVADRSPTGRWFLGIVVADQSPIDLQPKNAVFDRTVLALVAAVFLVTRQSPTGCSTCVTGALGACDFCCDNKTSYFLSREWYKYFSRFKIHPPNNVRVSQRSSWPLFTKQ